MTSQVVLPSGSRVEGYFGTGLVDSMLTTPRALELANVCQLLLPHENINIPSVEQILFRYV